MTTTAVPAMPFWRPMPRRRVVSLPSGLQYRILTAGTGVSPGPSDVVRVHYEGRLIDGILFDSSLERGEPARFPLDRVIPGWTQGLQLMREGAQWMLYIPPELAYGASSPMPAIAPNSTLVFKVELLEVLPSQ
ncbi:FKBP-type peptidyl-prolyl cis-trans isomerase [Marinobacterium aestuariivivens]|uniref:FKBP-type peptidyl-prolyl cis-trans isomerase n=1 Tax=Marinobacterium aestuariivivens TaxID=1698799 RepID=UPI0036D2DCE9